MDTPCGPEVLHTIFWSLTLTSGLDSRASIFEVGIPNLVWIHLVVLYCLWVTVTFTSDLNSRKIAGDHLSHCDTFLVLFHDNLSK